MKSLSILLVFLTLLFLHVTNVSHAMLITGNGKLVSQLELDVFNFRTIDEDRELFDTALLIEPSDTVLSTINYDNNPNPTPDELRGYGSASLSVQYGKIIGVSSWFGLQPQPWFGLNGTAASVNSLANFVIPDITIDYRGVEEHGDQVNADLHVTTNIVGKGRHTMDISASLPGNTQSKRLLNDVNGQLSLTSLVTNFTGFTLPVGDLFDLSLTAFVQSISIDVTTIADGDGVRHQSDVNWSVTLGGSPAFMLPAGYYANSADGSIVDNYFVSSSTSNPSVAIPEPKAFTLLVLAFFLLVFTRHIGRTV